ncbi:MAG: HD domain-containing protein [Alphaproteobacteria bacterium]|nr:HD domain-containing protein [Alphaproteobacteria bacterium]
MTLENGRVEPMPPSIDDTIAFIQKAHAGQVDKGGNPYWLHPVSVMRRLGPDAAEPERLVALLHDIIEDTPVTANDLRAMGYGDDIVAAVEMLSRPPGPTYMQWVKSLAASGNRLAIRVKIADNEDNSDPVRIALLAPEQQGIAKRYAGSLRVLRQALA